MNYILYIHIFPNKKVYIGITSKYNVNSRWRNGNGYFRSPFMKNAIQKYGWDNIEHIILYKNLTKEEAERKEIELISKYKSNNRKYGYNLAKGGNTSNGYKHTPEQIEKQKKNRKPYITSEETKRKISISNKKAWENPELRKKASDIQKETYKNGRIPYNQGKKLSQETINKIKATRKVKYIKCIEKNAIYRGTRDAAEKLGIDRRTIMRILNKECGFKSSKGLHFEYVEAQ